VEKLESKRVIVLGGTSGIGLAVARALLERGAQVIGAGRSAERAEQASAALGGRATLEQVDVQDREALAALFDRHAPFDHLVNSATGGERETGPFLQMNLDGFVGSFRKLWGYVNSVQLAAPRMSRGGSIVLVGGALSRKCRPGMSAHSTVGNAIEGFCRAVAPEIAPIRINVVAPGLIDTPMFGHLDGSAREAFFRGATAQHVIQRPGRPEEIADGILFLLQNEFITGTTLDVDGGSMLP
jgi:NAD(P)-dependent dehydrogenase (short-subunit alcohol dehydrogenase family)